MVYSLFAVLSKTYEAPSLKDQIKASHAPADGTREAALEAKTQALSSVAEMLGLWEQLQSKDKDGEVPLHAVFTVLRSPCNDVAQRIKHGVPRDHHGALHNRCSCAPSSRPGL